MADVGQYVFQHREVVEALIKQQDLHEGLWGLVLQFGFGAMNIGQAPIPTDGGPPTGDLNPAAVTVVTGIGLQRATERSNLVVDAAEVNPQR
jgi:hypothetical protein